ncbi:MULTISPECIES: lecithin retinol acyltransferase family protein [Vibrio]|uniref:lecithin retinol acyltransferase family protein n=1 Tax=Vibrio TaxID=662 RepID=UPI0021607D57|nr:MULTISPECIES: lecithin retinol acyltransferase family protein [Vibrio]MCS0183510.1 lecithin retinol acyltransferase family protein [Vibrio alginolyticus]MDW3152617.1 lecithin retinol acyltransferase family protein [Vibrio sp. 779(2023)]
MEHLQPGDHLVVDISNNTSQQYTRYAGAKHHGLYIGDDIVIHFDAYNDMVTKDTLGCFGGGCPISVKRHATIPRRAIELAHNKLGEGGYNVLTNNCEHFVNYCLDDHHTSGQVADNYHVGAHVAARAGLLGRGALDLAKGPIGIVTIGSTLAKTAGETLGLPDRVNTVIGTPVIWYLSLWNHVLMAQGKQYQIPPIRSAMGILSVPLEN